MRRAATRKPADYQITDAIREWSARKYGHAYLPDVFLEDWQNKAEARGYLYANLERALQNFITWAAPAGPYYSAQGWEAKLKAAKAKGNGTRTCKPALRVAGIEVEPMQITTSRDAARAALAAIKRGIA